MTKPSLAEGLVMGAATAAAVGFRETPVRTYGGLAVVAGTVCLDRYEASVWRVPHPTTTNASLVRKIQLGRVTQADLTAGGATQLGRASDDYAPCTNNGQNCAYEIYAVSLPSEIPSRGTAFSPLSNRNLMSVPSCVAAPNGIVTPMQRKLNTPRSYQRTTSGPALELPPDRAFVLHLDTRAQPPRRVIGRVEHVTSGRVTHVTSLRELLAFLADVLRQQVAGD